MTTMTDSRRAARPSTLRLSTSQKILLLVATVAAAAVALSVIVVRHLPAPPAPFDLPWIAWAAAFAAAEVLVVHVQLRRDAHSFSLTDLVLVVGLHLAAPLELVTAQVVGAAAALVLHRKQRSIKLVFNIAQYALGGCIAVTVFHTLGQGGATSGPLDWVAALIAVATTTLAADLCIFAVISISTGRSTFAELPKMLSLSMPFTLGIGAVGLVAARTAVNDAGALVLLVFPAVLVITAYRAYTKAREQQQSLRTLHEVTSLLHHASDPDAALTDFLTSVRGAFRSQVAELVLLRDHDDDSTVTRSRDGADPDVLVPVEDLADVRRLVQHTVRVGTPTSRTGVSNDAPIDRYAAGRGLKDAMVSVLRTEDRVHGLLLVAGRMGDVGRFSASDLALLETFAGHVATSLERGRLETNLRQVTELKEQLRYQAMHDGLTGLPNRTLFLDRARHAVEAAARTDAWPAVLFIDLDGFKPVNDEYGHDVGDLVLRTVAARLSDCLRPTDTAARLGGDEFAVLLQGPIDRQGVDRVIDRLTAQFDAPVDLGDGRTATIGASIGIAVGSSSVEDVDALIRQADVAMYAAKRGGGGALHYRTGMGDPASIREDAVAELGRATAEGEMVTYFQPLVDLRTGQVSGAEALVRWRHPDGLRGPESFIGLAEDTGLILEIGEQVLRQSCHQAARWAAADPSRPLTVTVNLSARQLAHPTIVDVVADALRDAGLDAKRLVLEMTETVLMHDRDAAAATLWQLKALGVRIAIDDFGTGYSSLAYLRRFPIDMLKIAREFVNGLGRDEHDDVITRAIVELAGTLGLLTVAEGIETREQQAFVTALGCDLGQGYLFSRPVDPDTAHDLVTGGSDAARARPTTGGALLRVV